jgi:uncharacterized protein YcaQ
MPRAPLKGLLSVVGDMTGAQAQLLSAAQTSLWARVQDLRIADIEQALSERALVQAACMRQTQFLVPSEHLAIFVRGSTRRAEKEIRWTLGKGVPERVVEAAIEATLAVLDQPLTRPQIAERVSQALGVEKQAIHGGGWGSRRKVASVPVGEIIFPVVDLLHLVAARGVVCSGPRRGSKPTFVRAEAWIPDWQDLPREQAEELLLRRYLKAFGPATAADFAMWTGVTLREAREIWTRQEAEIAPVNVQGWEAAALREDLAALAQASFAGPQVCLLPYFDPFLLGHKQRNHLVAMEQHAKVYRPQGWIAPVVLLNGRVRAVWEQVLEGDRLLVKVNQFEPFSADISRKIREEAQDLGRFLGARDVDVQIG